MMVYLILFASLLLTTSNQADALTIKSLKTSPRAYSLVSGPEDLCPEPEVSFIKNKGIVVGTNIFIGYLTGKSVESGAEGLDCFLKKRKCKEFNPNYYRKTKNTISENAGVVSVSTSDENWLYLDGFRRLHSKELKVWDHKMEYRAQVFKVKSKKKIFASSSLKSIKKITCLYKVN